LGVDEAPERLGNLKLAEDKIPERLGNLKLSEGLHLWLEMD
jgi:hypothetical protein